MTGRTVPEWIGATPDAKVPKRVRARVFLREGGRCYLTGRAIRVGEAWDLDHRLALCNGGEHRESNLFPALKDPHRQKTAADVGAKAKADRIRAKHLGLWPKSTRAIPSRPFPKRQGA